MPGPYLKAALLCEKVIEDKRGVLSMIGVVDRTTRTVTGPNPPAQMEPFTHRLFLVVALVSGDARGTHEVSLALQKPSGLREPLTTGSVLFEGDDRGANVIVELNIEAEMEGLYWVEVFLENEVITRVPWRVVYQRLTQRLPGP